MAFMMPKVKKPDPPPHTPTRADASVIAAGDRAAAGYESLINTGSQGLKSKASGNKRTLIGGGS